MSWKQSLDKFLTSPPNDDYQNWCEYTYEELSQEFFDKNEIWLFSEHSVVNKWLESLFSGKTPSEAAKIIERTYRRYEIEIKKSQNII